MNLRACLLAGLCAGATAGPAAATFGLIVGVYSLLTYPDITVTSAFSGVLVLLLMGSLFGALIGIFVAFPLIALLVALDMATGRTISTAGTIVGSVFGYLFFRMDPLPASVQLLVGAAIGLACSWVAARVLAESRCL